jgi:hypothetical protein
LRNHVVVGERHRWRLFLAPHLMIGEHFNISRDV